MTDYEKSLERYVGGLAEFEKTYDPEGPAILSRLKERGRFWTPQRKPRQYSYGPLKMCFKNAAVGAFRYGLRYVEGIAHGFIPVQHAWNVDEEGNVVDLTWRTTGSSKFKHDVADLAYFGVEVPREDLDRILARTGTYGAVFKNRGLFDRTAERLERNRSLTRAEFEAIDGRRRAHG